MAAAWDHCIKNYERGRFEPVVSMLGEQRTLAEQMLVEVASGLSRTRSQLHRHLQHTLAAHQGKLCRFQPTLNDMINSGMLREVHADDADGPALKATRLGRIAVRQMLAPATVLLLAKWLTCEEAEKLQLFDLLVLATLTEDCQPLIPVDFEELDGLAARLAKEPSFLLAGRNKNATLHLGCGGRKALAVLKTAMVAIATKSLTTVGLTNRS